jgi:hypothetical protein
MAAAATLQSANRRGSNRGAPIPTAGVPKREVKEEDDEEEAAKATKMAEYLHRERLIASSYDPEDCPGLNVAFMATLNDTDT